MADLAPRRRHSSASSHGTALLPCRPGCARLPNPPGFPDGQRYWLLPHSGHMPAPCSSSRSQARATASVLRRSLMSSWPTAAGSTRCRPAASRPGERLASFASWRTRAMYMPVEKGARKKKKKNVVVVVARVGSGLL